MNQTVKPVETYINCDGQVACASCGAVEPDLTVPCQKCIDHAAKMAKHIADNHAASAQFSKELVSVTRTEVKNGFQFVGTLANGETIVLRAKATRPYTVAAIHSYGVVSKFRNYDDNIDVRSFVTFHQATPKPAYKSDVIIRTLPIVELTISEPSNDPTEPMRVEVKAVPMACSNALTVEAPATPAPVSAERVGFLFDSRVDLVDQIERAKRAALRQAKLELDGDLVFSFPNPYLLAMDASGNRFDDQERCHFTAFPNKRTIAQLSEHYADRDHTIVCYYDLYAGTTADRLAGNSDEPTDLDAEIVMFRHVAAK